MILIYINNNFEANITHLCPMSNGLMLSFSPADRRALWLASDNSCCGFFSANLWDILQIVGMCTLIFYFLGSNFHLNDGKILGYLQDVFY